MNNILHLLSARQPIIRRNHRVTAGCKTGSEIRGISDNFQLPSNTGSCSSTCTLSSFLCPLLHAPGYALRAVLCVLLVSVLLFAGCRTSDKPKDVMPESEYTELLMEVFITQNLIQLKELTEKRDSVMTDLFDRYGVTEDQFRRSHEYYQIQTDEHKERIDRIRDRLREEREKIDKVRQEQTNTNRDLRTQPESSNRRP